MSGPKLLKIKIQCYCGDEIAMGPGKADLLDAIMTHGSISAAGRALGMSYRRTWMLVDTMNRCWSGLLVETSAGGTKGGGARVTELGRSILQDYRALQQSLDDTAQSQSWRALEAAIRQKPIPNARR